MAREHLSNGVDPLLDRACPVVKFGAHNNHLLLDLFDLAGDYPHTVSK